MCDTALYVVRCLEERPGLHLCMRPQLNSP